MIRALILISLLIAVVGYGATRDEEATPERARKLKAFIQKERPAFDERETQKQDLIEELDKLNVDQNHIRQRLDLITSNQQEMTMALENLSLEFEKQKKLEAYEKQRVQLLFKLVYRVKRDGLLKFLVYGENFGHLASRLRVLYRTLRSHSQATRQLAQRAIHLAESETKLKSTQAKMQGLLGELQEQEDLLKEFLERKHALLKRLNRQQNSYQLAVREYKRVSKEVAALFEDFESQRDIASEPFQPLRKSLPLPLDTGHVVRNFGKFVNPRFGTVTYEKGIEIEAEHNSPVRSILAGDIEYDGWVKGLGNVIIVHHGGGFYSLSAHLFKINKPKGTHVAQGDVIGFVGDTGGNSDRPSLYFELRQNNRAIDPLLFFSKSALDQLQPLS
jgi:septal ring factor EnvC (AmiA/AmiB activator)